MVINMSQQKNKYFIASIYYVIGNIIGQGVVLLSSAIFTRIMDKASYGMVNTYSAWVLVLNTFIGLNLFITVRNAYLDYKDDYENYQSSILLFSLIVYVVFTSIIIGVIKLAGINVDTFVVFIAALQAISVHTVNYSMAVLSMEGKYKPRTLLLVLPNVLHTLLSIILIIIYTEHKYYAKIIGNALGIFVFALIIIIHIFHVKRPKYNKEYWRYAAKIAVPAIMCTLSDLILLESDRIMLTELSGPASTAVYSLIYNIGSILIALYTAISGAWTPWFYKSVEKEKVSDIRKVESVYIGVFCFGAIGLLTISPEIIKILSPKTYWSGIDYVSLIIIASYLIFLYSFLTTYLMYLKKPGVIAVNTAIAAGLNLILNYFLIKQYDGIGAAVATIISYTVLFVLHYFAAIRYRRDVFCLKTMLISMLALIAYSVVFAFIKDLIVVRYCVVAIILIVLGYLYFTKKKDFKF